MVTRRLARNFGLDVSRDGAANWLRCTGVVDFGGPAFTPTKADSTDVDSGGFKSITVTDQAWSIGTKYNRLSLSGLPDPVQMLIESTEGQSGGAGELYIRIYETDGGSYAVQGRAVASLTRSKTSEPDLSEITVMFDGDGACGQISNPNGTPRLPAIVSALPGTAPTGALVTITGQNFTGTTAVAFGAVNAPGFTVLLNGTVIVVPMPAGGTDATTVTVTNAVGSATNYYGAINLGQLILTGPDANGDYDVNGTALIGPDPSGDYHFLAGVDLITVPGDVVLSLI
ncbi:IPT/TIG domain-containing protein [Jatrophihabitans sp. GAS493]|uniref:phage tail tube protein n=1 Tax=Jatrophihabitans sp. GAS493 TaxID=1907575 RepID=UPI000BB91ED1|nr:IPT/TIG domain-containing protein [Jatrophihabitans sp. GAS493]SOD72708.1 IPT/TIG domain-containing protein [Jatrophihabitans sp. GAS493]